MEHIEQKINALEKEMQSPSFWEDKARAEQKLSELRELKSRLSESKKLLKGDAIVTIFSGAGGLDAEDWSRMLFGMYTKFAERGGFNTSLIHKNENDHGGFRNITFLVSGTGAYGALKNESGVHRLVRISPFSAKKLRHTSFSLVEVVPKFEAKEIEIPEQDVRIEFTRSGGPGGQNVNKRETAVRVVHIPTGISVHADSERSQSQNREQALQILRGKLYKMEEEKRRSAEAGFQISKEVEAEWGSQIRSYVLHPYKLVKDHRTGVEHKDPNQVLLEGDLPSFIEAESGL